MKRLLKNKIEENEVMLKTVKQNKIGFSDAQISDKKRAKKLYNKLGAPGIGNFKYIIKGNMIKDCPVKTEV